jgi:flagellin-like protein
MKSFRRSVKALSPVVASIILIAVTVAVSIAVAVWMGALSTGFMQTEQLTITSATFGPGNANVTLAVSNTGTTSVTVNQVWVGNTQIVSPAYGGSMTASGTLASNAQGTITITTAFTSSYNYLFKLVSSKGTTFQYTAIAP